MRSSLDAANDFSLLLCFCSPEHVTTPQYGATAAVAKLEMCMENFVLRYINIDRDRFWNAPSQVRIAANSIHEHLIAE